MDKSRNALTVPITPRAVVYSRSRMSRKGIPVKNRQKKEAGQNYRKLTVRDGQALKLTHLKTGLFVAISSIPTPISFQNEQVVQGTHIFIREQNQFNLDQF